jgi:DNA repair exonuclease SbcCD ATPase subunit
MDNIDIYGRIESFDQSVRSLNRRLRAVERRLTASKDDRGLINFEIEDEDQWNDIEIEEIRTEIHEFRNILEGVSEELSGLKSNMMGHVNESISSLQDELKTAKERIDELIKQQSKIEAQSFDAVDSINSNYQSETATLRKELKDTQKRLHRQESLNKITVGTITVPVELSGIVASIALILTGFLVWADRWDIIRSVYYPTWLALLFALVVITKFIMANRNIDS